MLDLYFETLKVTRVFGMSEFRFRRAGIYIQKPNFAGVFEGVAAEIAAWSQGESRETKLR